MLSYDFLGLNNVAIVLTIVVHSFIIYSKLKC
jgi:hypothetical protein